MHKVAVSHIWDSIMQFNIRSKNFRNGFIDGFTAYYHFRNGIVFSRASKTDASMQTSWAEIGKALKKAENIERGNISKETRRIG